MNKTKRNIVKGVLILLISLIIIYISYLIIKQKSCHEGFRSVINNKKLGHDFNIYCGHQRCLPHPVSDYPVSGN